MELNFKNFIEQIYQPNPKTIGTEEVDESQVDTIYDKTKIAVQIVRAYDQTRSPGKKLLLNVSTIANLASGAYGLYNSGENKEILSQVATNKIRIKFGEDFIRRHGADSMPLSVLKKYFPDLGPNDIKPSDVIHVNVSRIIREKGDNLSAILEIASTIVHEATHELEMSNYGKTSEVGPVAAEKEFSHWFLSNFNYLRTKIPALNQYSSEISRIKIA